ncbi:MAG: quinone oxidoreductase family protein [Sphingobacteriaceae bacterium]
MRAVVLEGLNVPLSIKEIVIPLLSAGEVLVKIKAAALNRRDYWITKGQYAGIQYPAVLGSDGAGIIVDVASDVDKAWIEREVVIYPGDNWGDNPEFQQPDFKILGLPDNGTFAEFVKVSVTYVHPKPTHLTWEEAAAFPLAGLTAFRALFTKGRLQKSDKVLIIGVGGGTATFALQWALTLGCQVFVTSGNGEKVDQAKQLGAVAGVSYKAQNWAEQLKQLAGGFDVIIDSSLGEGFTHLPDLCNRGARIVFFGGTAGNFPTMNARPLFWKQVSILGTTMGNTQEFGAMVDLINQKKVIPVVDEIFRFSNAAQAFRKMEDSSQFGKIILVP